MITLYDLAFDEDRRPSPFCWRAKFSLAHKGLDYASLVQWCPCLVDTRNALRDFTGANISKA